MYVYAGHIFLTQKYKEVFSTFTFMKCFTAREKKIKFCLVWKIKQYISKEIALWLICYIFTNVKYMRKEEKRVKWNVKNIWIFFNYVFLWFGKCILNLTQCMQHIHLYRELQSFDFSLCAITHVKITLT